MRDKLAQFENKELKSELEEIEKLKVENKKIKIDYYRV
jgi:hypothetical protein